MRFNIEEWLDDAVFTLFLEQDLHEGLDILLAEGTPLEHLESTVIGHSLASREEIIPGWAVYGLLQYPFIDSKYHKELQSALRMGANTQLQYAHVKLTEKSARFFKELQQFVAKQRIPSYMTAMVLDKPEILLWGYNPLEPTVELINPDLAQPYQELVKYFLI